MLSRIIEYLTDDMPGKIQQVKLFRTVQNDLERFWTVNIEYSQE